MDSHMWALSVPAASLKLTTPLSRAPGSGRAVVLEGRSRAFADWSQTLFWKGRGNEKLTPSNPLYKSDLLQFRGRAVTASHRTHETP